MVRTRRSKRQQSVQQGPPKDPGGRRREHGAWPEYDHLFAPSSTQDSDIVKKELFRARNRRGEDISFCVDSTPINVDDEPPLTAPTVPTSQQQPSILSKDQHQQEVMARRAPSRAGTRARRVTIWCKDTSLAPSSPALAKEAAKQAPPSTIVRHT